MQHSAFLTCNFLQKVLAKNTLLLLIAHFSGDFIFQSSNVAYNKMYNKKSFFIHCAIYAIAILAALISFGPTKRMLIIFLIIVVTHAIIDYCRIKFLIYFENKKVDHKYESFSAFIIDQALHIFVILICGYFIAETGAIGRVILDIICSKIEISQLNNILVYILLYIICLSPAAVFIKKVFVFFSIQNDKVNCVFRRHPDTDSGNIRTAYRNYPDNVSETSGHLAWLIN